MNISWNLTSRRKLIKKSDIYIFSVAKSGRTWLRVLINKYLSLAYNVPFGLDDLNKSNKIIPSILFTHELWVHYSIATPRQKLLGKFIVPDKFLRSKKVVVLYRDPRDVLVSLFFHKSKRSEIKTQKNISDFISDKRHGIDLIINVMNQWRERLENSSNCFWLSYEDLKRDTFTSFKEVLNFLNFTVINEDFIQQAITFSEFKNMKKMEAEGSFGSKIMRPGDQSDPDSFKVRKGIVGGYMNHFSDEDLHRLDQAVSGLHPFFGYNL